MAASKGFRRMVLAPCLRLGNTPVFSSVVASTLAKGSVASREMTNSSPVSEALPSQADVVVIGGGVIGCSTLYHLAKLGVTDAVLFEGNKITSGTTWHTAGLLSSLRLSETEVKLVQTTRDLLMRLESETGVNPGWINNGTLMVADSKIRLNEYKHLKTHGRSHGIDAILLDVKETKELYPLLNMDGLEGSLYIPADGTIDPAGYCTAMIRSAKRAGATVLEDCPVSGISTADTLLGGRKITEVHTPYGVIKTNAVVNATGGWGNKIANMVGLHIPLVVLEHSYVVTEAISGIEGMPNLRDPKSSTYLKLQGDALAIGGFETSPVWAKVLETDSPFQLYELNWDAFGELLEGAVKRVPVLEHTGIKSTISGPESFTPDHAPVMGEDPNVEGFFHCCGFNSYGMRLSGGCGDQMAKWIVRGRPELDMFSFDVRRLHAPLSSKKSWVDSKVHESYSKRYSIHFKHDEPLAGRGQRLSPLHKLLEAQGCVFQERCGWERPSWFNTEQTPAQPYDWYGCYGTKLNSDQRYHNALKLDYSYGLPDHHHLLAKECLSCREAAAIFDLSHFGKFHLVGPDAQQAADWIFSANVNKSPGSTVYTCMLNQWGGIEADLTVSICENDARSEFGPSFEGRSFYLVVGTTTATYCSSHILKEIRKHGWDVQLLNSTEDLAVLSLQGPCSREILQSVSDDEFSNESFPFSTHKIVTVAGYEVRAMRITFVGEMGWELHMPKESAIPVYEALMAAGKPLGLINAGYRAQDSLAAEKGYRRWHSDIRPEDTPLDAGLVFTCKLSGDVNFLGCQALKRQRSAGISKKLVTLTLKDRTRPLWGNEVILRDDQPLGSVRRAEYAFSLGRTICYGYVRHPGNEGITRDFLESGTWNIESMGEVLEASLHTKHPFDPKNMRVKGL
ncbi:sarcosine dehydrogenase, mitochondrial-like [Macrobrachium nipponense]|uniref:sarcosine dehydrogenase, mitochondrial-like n=1 Tax=Macrobrachium nipponense TaxID=159736 RepID=UPI0030C7FA08